MINLNSLFKIIFVLITNTIMVSCQKQVDYGPQILILTNNVSSLQVALNSSLAALQKSRDSLTTSLAQTNANLTNTNTNVSNLGLRMDSVKTALLGINTQLTYLSLRIDSANTKIALLNTQMATANSNIATINTQVIAINTNIENFTISINTLNKQYTSLLATLNNILTQLAIPPTSLTIGLVAYYPFTGNANDSSVYGNNGVINGATLTTDRNGISNSAYSFNGSSYIRIKGIDFSKSFQFSLSVWIKPSDISSNRYYEIIRQEGPAKNAPDFLLAFQEYGTILSFGLTTGNLNYLELDLQINKLNYANNKWHNILISYDGSYKNIYLDGNFIGNQIQSGNINYNNTIASIGSTSATLEEFFNGSIDDLRIYNRVLNSSEISYLATH